VNAVASAAFWAAVVAAAALTVDTLGETLRMWYQQWVIRKPLNINMWKWLWKWLARVVVTASLDIGVAFAAHWLA
jgi:hypothetical protein